MWETHGEWNDTLKHYWSADQLALSLEELRTNLNDMANNLGKWNRETFGNVRKEIKQLLKDLERLRVDPTRMGPTHPEIKINERFVELYHREELMWRQRARTEWLSSGDKNTKNSPSS